MSNCVYSDPKLKKIHYHLHYKQENGKTIEAAQAAIFNQQTVSYGNSNQQQANVLQQSNGAQLQQQPQLIQHQQNRQVKTFQVAGQQRMYNTGYVEVDTTQIETIDINQKLLVERDQLRVRVYELEQQLTTTLDEQKASILLTCEQQYCQQLAMIEKEHNLVLEKESTIQQELKQSLVEATAKITTLEQNVAALQSTLDSFEKRYAKNNEKYKNTKEVLKKEIQSQADSYEEQIQDLKEKCRLASSLSDKSTKTFYEEQIVNLKSQLAWRDTRVAKLEQDCAQLDQQLHLKTMELSSFQLQSRIQLQEQLDKFSLQRNQTEAEKQVAELRRQYERIISNLEDKIDKQRLKIQNYKLEASRVVIQPAPIIIEKPVQVETVLETMKYLPIERVVRESGVERSQGGVNSGKEQEGQNELIKHYEEIMGQDQQKIDTLQRKISALSKLNQLQQEHQAIKDLQVIDAEETLRKYQTENDNLKEGLRSFEINLNNAAEQYESKR